MLEALKVFKKGEIVFCGSLKTTHEHIEAVEFSWDVAGANCEVASGCNSSPFISLLAGLVWWHWCLKFKEL